MRFACPGRINELIEAIFLANNTKEGKDAGGYHNQSTNVTGQSQTPRQEKSQDSAFMKNESSSSQKNDTPKDQKEPALNPRAPMVSGPVQDETLNQPTSAWAWVLEAATQRRTEVLHPENLENMWARGRNYNKKRCHKKTEGSGKNENFNDQTQTTEQNVDGVLSDQSKTSELSDLVDENNSNNVVGSKSKLETSNSVADLNIQNQVGGPIISEFYSADVGRDNDVKKIKTVSDKVTRTERSVPKLSCRVLGAYFENDSKSFAVYSIAVMNAENKTWFVERRYRNFDRLHRNLKDVPNYTLNLPPKRIFSSSTEDAFDLLSIPNIFEQNEVWDFLSMTSKSYSFGRPATDVRPLAVNVDDAVNQFKGGLKRKVVGRYSPSECSSPVVRRNVSLKTDSGTKRTTSYMANSFSDIEEGEKERLVNHEEKVGPAAQASEPILEKNDEQNRINTEVRSEILNLAATITSITKEDPLGVPAEVNLLFTGISVV
ncbi:uncharacterized protein LOC143609228 [Bidens hawaiensis]|uniref:uncharacterized protein LOC143609228 n=1 Tax=Bidens hawaiensis TaxID=980011 RepID=UPI00404AE048